MRSSQPVKLAKPSTEPLLSMKEPEPFIPFYYEAPEPEVSMEHRSLQIMLRVICPPLLLWDVASYLLNKWLGKKIGRMVLPSQTAKELAPYRVEEIKIAFTEGLSVDAVIDSMKALSSTHATAPQQQPIVPTTEYDFDNNEPETKPEFKHLSNRAAKLTPQQHQEQLYKKFLRHNNLIVQTYDGAELDTFEVKYHEYDHAINKDVSSRNYVINFASNAGCAEMDLDTMRQDAIDLQCNQIAFNYRGVNHSKGVLTCKEDLITDGIAQVQRLLDKRVNPERIILKGFSLGGAIATQVVKHFHARGIYVYLYNDRSFSSLTRLVCGRFRSAETGTGHQQPNRILASILKPFVKLALLLTKWEIDAGSSYSEISGRFKRHILVRSSHDKRSANPKLKDDSFVTHYASLHNDPKVKSQRKEMLVRLAQDRKEYLTRVRNEPYYDEAKAQTQDDYDDAKHKQKAVKMFVCVDGKERNEEGHTAPRAHLSNRYGETATQHFNRFFYHVNAMNDEIAQKDREAKMKKTRRSYKQGWK